MLHLRPFRLPDDGQPVERIVSAMLGHSILEGVSEIYIPVPPAQSEFSVSFRGRESLDLQNQIRLPSYVWKPFRAYLEGMAGENGAFEIALRSENPGISLRYRIEMSIQEGATGETIVLKLSGKFQAPFIP